MLSLLLMFVAGAVRVTGQGASSSLARATQVDQQAHVSVLPGGAIQISAKDSGGPFVLRSVYTRSGPTVRLLDSVANTSVGAWRVVVDSSSASAGLWTVSAEDDAFSLQRTVRQFIPIHPNQSQSIPINPNQSQSIPINPNQSQLIPTHPEHSQFIPIHPNSSQSILEFIRIHPNQSWN
eukprot:SAG31_NODE_7197_length_1759_cov_1.663253_1_plen_179_part_00